MTASHDGAKGLEDESTLHLEPAGLDNDATGPDITVAEGEPQTHSGATGFAAVQQALAAAGAIHDSEGGEVTPASTVFVDAGSEAEAGYHAAVPEHVASAPIARGDIRVVEPLPWLEGRRRLAVVRRVDSDHDVAEMMLVHPFPELATDSDAVIEDSGMPFPLVVECYVRGPVWLLQVGALWGTLTESQMDDIGRAVIDGDTTVEGVYVGLPLAGHVDPRWRFDEQEVAEWNALTGDCSAALWGDDEVWLLDPDRLQPDSYVVSNSTTPPRDGLRLAETVHLLTNYRTTMELQELDPAVADPELWVEHLGRSNGLSVFTALQPTMNRALSQWDAELIKEAA